MEINDKIKELNDMIKNNKSLYDIYMFLYKNKLFADDNSTKVKEYKIKKVV